MNNSIGIYTITNVINNKRYIGQSRNIKIRWRHHINSLNKNKHENQYLQHSYNKYGNKAFNFSILELCSKDKLNERENFYIHKYNTYKPECGFNLRFEQENLLKFTDDVIMKMRNSHRYEFLEVLQVDKNTGKLIQKYESISHAARDVDGTPSGIRNCANFIRGKGVSKTYKGYIWLFVDDYKLFQIKDFDKYMLNSYSFAVNKYEYPSGKYICTYSTVEETAKNNNVSNDVISMCIRGVQYQSNGYTYRKQENIHDFKDILIDININDRSYSYKPVIAYKKDTMEFYKHYSSISECKKEGFNTGHISECCLGKRKTHKGLIWKYFDENGIKKVEQKSLSDL